MTPRKRVAAPGTTYVTHDGMRVHGDARAVVRQLRDEQWGAPEKKRDWMEQVAERIVVLDPTARPTFSNADEFVALLVRVGLLRVAS